jgi:uncharacterized protein (DUF2236 family)
MTVGQMPPFLRERFGLRWTRGQAVTFDAMCALMRRSGALMPGPTKDFGPYYVRWRRRELERGDVASRTPPKRDVALA